MSLTPERRAELVERVRCSIPITCLASRESAARAVIDALAPELEPCPYIMSSDEGTAYCALAESCIRGRNRIEAERDQAKSACRERGDELLDLTEAHTKLLQERNGLVDALRLYGKHEWRCDASAYPVESFPCTCGFQAVLDAIDGRAK